MLCRTPEKASLMRESLGISTTCCEEEMLSSGPDLIVVAVNKTSISDVSLHYMKKGFPVVCETPVGMSEEELSSMYRAFSEGGNLFVAEQYSFEKRNRAVTEELEGGLIGEVCCVNLSQAHEYHGFALMRGYLGIPQDTGFSVRSVKRSLPVTRTADRYSTYEDGVVIHSERTFAFIEYEGNKVCLYDFDSQEYRSPIRLTSVHITGVRGEYRDGVFTYLDDLNHVKSRAVSAEKETDEQTVCRLLEMYYGILKEGRREEEKALLSSALQDAYSAILLRRAIDTGEIVYSSKREWN